MYIHIYKRNKDHSVNIFQLVILIALGMILASCQSSAPNLPTESTGIEYKDSSTTTPVILPTTPPIELSQQQSINIPVDCFFESISSNNAWIAISCPANIQTNTRTTTYWDVLVSKTDEINWVSVLPDKQLLSRPWRAKVAFSPDGKRLAILGKNDLLLLETDNWQNSQLTGMRNSFMWSPNGQILTVENKPGKNVILWSLSLDGQITPLWYRDDIFSAQDMAYIFTFGFKYGPSWNPDGTQIVYISSLDTGSLPKYWSSHNQLWILDTDSGKQTLMLDGDIGEAPAWSPDGHRILLQKERDIKIFDIEKQVIVATFSDVGSQALWSPDGKYLVALMLTGRSETNGLYFINCADNTSQKIMGWNGYPKPIQWTKMDGLVIEKSINNRKVIEIWNGYP